jgi:hypothetical protein
MKRPPLPEKQSATENDPLPVWAKELLREYAAAAYRAGQEEMRERAAGEAEGMDYSPDGAIARSIRALPLAVLNARTADDSIDAARKEERP